MKKIIFIIAALGFLAMANDVNDGVREEFVGWRIFTKRVEVDGVPCIIATSSDGIAMSCHWGSK